MTPGSGEIGLIGKIPSEGDFIQRHVSAAFADAWFDWLKPVFADPPPPRPGGTLPWLVWIDAGLLEPHPLLVVWQDSQDRVGRRFPFALILAMAPQTDPLALTQATALSSLEQLATLCARACRGETPAAALDANLPAPPSSDSLAGQTPRPSGVQEDAAAGHLLMWADHGHGADTMILHLLTLFGRQRGFQGQTLWWRPNSARGAGQGTFAWTATNGLPTAATLAMLMHV